MHKKKVLITGITGFAGSHLAEVLLAKEYDVYGTHVSNKLSNISPIRDSITLHTVNLLDKDATQKIIEEVKPHIVFHLAALTNVAKSFTMPIETLVNNVSAQINLFEALRTAQLSETRIVVTSSSHVYGLVAPENLPIDESVPFVPDNPYSVSKITQDYSALQYYLSYDMQIIRVRPFNHIGPRLSEEISVSRFAKKIAEIEKGIIDPVITVGNLSTKRDFTDVRDMVRAYIAAAELADPGDVYNIGSGVSYKIGDILERLLGLSSTKITIQEDPSLFRPSDIPELLCNPQKFMQKTGWKLEIPLEKTLRDTLDYWRERVR